jgi:dihydrofolate reductase
MRPVVLQVFDLSIDGVIGAEGTEFFDFCRAIPDDPAHAAWLVSSLERAGVHIMGRVTYEGMAQYFPTATGGIADVLNRAPKAVFSSTLQVADWAGATSSAATSRPGWTNSGAAAPGRSWSTAESGSFSRWPGWTWSTSTG